MDDWAYQANVRQQLEEPDVEKIKAKMRPFETIISQQLEIKVDAKYTFPWHRLFEVEVNEYN